MTDDADVPPSNIPSSVAVTSLTEITPVPLETNARLAVVVASFDSAIAAEDFISAFTIFVMVLLSESIVCPSIVVVPLT